MTPETGTGRGRREEQTEEQTEEEQGSRAAGADRDQPGDERSEEALGQG